jgi:serine/threonine-protein kinase
MSQILVGQTLGERYHFEELLGEGTFAYVYRIFDQHRHVKLAAKVLRPEISHDSALLQRFQREATILSQLRHPNIVRYYDTVQLADYLFILTDYIPGQTLKAVLQSLDYVLTPRASLVYLTPLAAALNYAHYEGVIHRDLKPGNILIHENSTLYVTDFSISRILSESSSLIQGVKLGTPQYMSPEQITGESTTTATDIYALGVMLYQFYTGWLPFRGDSPEAVGSSTASRIAYEHVNVPPVPPTAVNPALSLAVQDVILRCLQKSPTRRFRSVSELYDSLAEAVGAPPMLLDPPTPQNMKLPEWSQFMRPVEETPAPKPDDTPVEPITRPHLEKVLERDTDNQMLTRPALHRVLQEAHPTEPRKIVLPPPAYSPPIYAHQQERHPEQSGRRSKTLILLTFGFLALIIALCILGIYWFT